MGSFPVTLQHCQEVCGVPTTFVLTAFSNRIMVVITQTPNFGTLIHAEADRPLDPSAGSFSTRVLFGRRDDETLEVYARTLIELISQRSAIVRPLLLAISIREHSAAMFRGVIKVCEEHRVW
mmetsp:Transcript_5/g.9  ORF Transcript_5/g.9 Transcript_5/m.9 type:complete len:122 (-) Transcript_5:75-440(-)